MINSDCLSIQTPDEGTVTLEEIIPTLIGKYVKIEIEIKAKKKTAEGLIKKTTNNKIWIGETNYRPDTPVLGVIMIKSAEEKTSLCKICCLRYCGNTPSDQCQAIIASIMCRKAI